LILVHAAEQSVIRFALDRDAAIVFSRRIFSGDFVFTFRRRVFDGRRRFRLGRRFIGWRGLDERFPARRLLLWRLFGRGVLFRRLGFWRGFDGGFADWRLWLGLWRQRVRVRRRFRFRLALTRHRIRPLTCLLKRHDRPRRRQEGEFFERVGFSDDDLRALQPRGERLQQRDEGGVCCRRVAEQEADIGGLRQSCANGFAIADRIRFDDIEAEPIANFARGGGVSGRGDQIAVRHKSRPPQRLGRLLGCGCR